MEVKAAVKRAKIYVADLLEEEGLRDLGLEEVYYDDRDGVWNITVGFSRPWNATRSPIAAITGDEVIRRAHRVVRLRDEDGEIISFKKRDDAEPLDG